MENLLTLSIMLCSLISEGQINFHSKDSLTFSSSAKMYSGWVDNNANSFSIKQPNWNLKVFDSTNKIVASMDSAHILTVYDSLATIKAFIKGYGIEIKGYNKFNQSEQ